MPRPIAPILLLSLIPALMSGGCTNSAILRAGATGAPLTPGQAMTIIGANPNGTAIAARAQDAVIAALGRHGHAIAPEAAGRLEIGVTDRPASTGIAVIGGPELSAAKSKKFLQNCKDHTYRLVLTYYGGTSDVTVSRAWAEAHHCKGTLDASLSALAESAVAALVRGPSGDLGKRRGKD